MGTPMRIRLDAQIVVRTRDICLSYSYLLVSAAPPTAGNWRSIGASAGQVNPLVRQLRCRLADSARPPGVARLHSPR
jgi:hypothetical protein